MLYLIGGDGNGHYRIFIVAAASIDRPNSHPQKEEYFLLLLVLLFLDLLR